MAAPVKQLPTRVDDVDVHASGWVTWNGYPTTALPLVDKRTGLFARVMFGADSIAAAAKVGGRLLTEAEFRKLHATPGVAEPSPCSLTMNKAELAQAEADGILLHVGEGANRKPTTAHLNRHSQHMVSLAWFQRHDQCFFDKLIALGWNGQAPVSNAGKQVLWPDGIVNFGWFVPVSPDHKNGLIQTAGHFHGPGHYDYSQLLMVTKAPPPSGGGGGGVPPGGGGGGGLPVPGAPGSPGAMTRVGRELLAVTVGGTVCAGLGWLLGHTMGSSREIAGVGLGVGALAGLAAVRKGPST